MFSKCNGLHCISSHRPFCYPLEERQPMADDKANIVDTTRESTRDQVTGPLARWIVGGGLIYLGIISAISLVGALFVSKDQQQAITSQWKDILTFTLPVLGAWVGTVLAF